MLHLVYKRHIPRNKVVIKRMHNLFVFLLWGGNSLPQQRDRCTDLSLVSAHPSPDTPSPSLSLRASAFLAFHCACDICPTQLDLMRATAWSMRSESNRMARKKLRERERNKELCCLCQQLAAEDHPVLPNGHTPATNSPCRRQRITRTPCVPYSDLPALIPSSGFFSTFALRVHL